MSYAINLIAVKIIYEQFIKLNEYKIMMKIPYRYETTTFEYKIIIEDSRVTIFELRSNYVEHTTMEHFFHGITK